MYIMGRCGYMSLNYEENLKIMKTLSNSNRLKIINILSCEDRYVCDILDNFNFARPTLSRI